MKSYNIKKDIYIVGGRKKSCIYDCANNKHYWVDNSVKDFLERLTKRMLNESDIDSIKEALSLDIIEETNEKHCQEWPNINELFNFPRHLDYAWIEITNQCNLRCTHCYNETAQRVRKYMSYDDFTFVVDELVRFGIKSVQLIGGDPFLLKEDTLFKMFDYASKSFQEFEIFFNGTLTKRKHLEIIKEKYSNCKIAMSLHSFIEDEHEKITQVKGSYDKSVNTLRILQELGIKFRYVGIYADGIEIGKEIDFGIPYRRDYIRLTGRGNLKHYNRKLLEDKIITQDNLKFKDLTKKLKMIYSEYCFANYLYIGSDLNVYPCVMERRLCHGNIRNHSLTEIIDKNLINYSKENVKECGECEFRHLCKDCRPDSLGMEINDKPWYCSYNVTEGEWENKDQFIDKLLEIRNG